MITVVPSLAGNSARSSNSPTRVSTSKANMAPPYAPSRVDVFTVSANLTGLPSALDDEEAKAYFGEAVAVYIEGSAPGGVASTIIDVTEEDPLTIRQGPVAG